MEHVNPARAHLMTSSDDGPPRPTGPSMPPYKRRKLERSYGNASGSGSYDSPSRRQGRGKSAVGKGSNDIPLGERRMQNGSSDTPSNNGDASSQASQNRSRYDKRGFPKHLKVPPQHSNNSSVSSHDQIPLPNAVTSAPISGGAGNIPVALAANITLTKSESLPPAPPVTDEYAAKVFTHRSLASVDPSKSYESLEFLGDAYLELMSSRLIFERCQHLDTGKMSRLRESLVRNTTLAKFSQHYGFDKRLRALPGSLKESSTVKIHGDVFEAYSAAVVLSNPQDGFRICEEWMAKLWADMILNSSIVKRQDNSDALVNIRKELVIPGTELIFEQLSVEVHYGQGIETVHVAAYLVSEKHGKQLLGKGQGLNMKEAKADAAEKCLQERSKLFIKAQEKKKEYQSELEQTRGLVGSTDAEKALKLGIEHLEKTKQRAQKAANTLDELNLRYLKAARSDAMEIKKEAGKQEKVFKNEQRKVQQQEKKVELLRANVAEEKGTTSGDPSISAKKEKKRKNQDVDDDDDDDGSTDDADDRSEKKSRSKKSKKSDRSTTDRSGDSDSGSEKKGKKKRKRSEKE